MMEVWVLFIVVCVLHWSAISVNGATNQADTAALEVMYNSLNSPRQLTGWSPSGGDPCGQSWKGIVCNGSVDRSHSLVSCMLCIQRKLSGIQLSGSLGYLLTSLTSVTNLNVAGNGFTGAVSYSISILTSLKYLNVSHNQLQGQIADIFGKLPDVTTMDFSFNALSGKLPESCSSLSSMTSLYLQNNQLTGPIDVLANLPLDNLNVANNQFRGWIPDQLKGIKNLKTDGNIWSSGPAPSPASTNTIRWQWKWK